MLIPRNLRGALTRESPIAANVIAFSGAQDHIKLPLNEDSAHSAHLALQAYYENMVFETGTMIEPSRQTIDHGRVETLKRREKFATLSAKLTLPHGGGTVLTIPNKALLSPRRIYRAILFFAYGPGYAESIAEEICDLMKNWRDESYPDFTNYGWASQVGDMRVELVQS